MATVQCEAWCDSDRYLWSGFSGRPGTNNDLSVLSHSPLFQNIFNDLRNVCVTSGYNIHKEHRPHYVLYFLVDGNYPRWLFFAKPIHGAALKCELSYSALQ